MTFTEEYLPDAKGHRDLSFVKSGIRLLACAIFFFASLHYGVPAYAYGSACLAIAEIIGVCEELV